MGGNGSVKQQYELGCAGCDELSGKDITQQDV